MTRICVVWAFYTVSVLGLVQAFIASSNSNRWISTKPPRAFSVLQLSASDAIADEIQGWDPSFYEIFMERYWQKKPVLIRQAFPQVMETLQLSPLDVYLAKLASDDDVETRTFRNRRGKWEKTYGPYEEREIVHCPKSNWSLLLQEVDRHVPRVADLWDRGFGFIPSWRRDDVMMSYSMPGGSIGAHVDNYDVFLIQGR